MKETGVIPAHLLLAVVAAAVTAGAVVTADRGHRGETAEMTAGRDLGAGMTAGAQGHGPQLPRPASTAFPLLRTAAAAAAAAQWPKAAGMIAMGTVAQDVMLLAAAHLLRAPGRMLALPPMVVAPAPAPEMWIPTIMLVIITGGVSLLTVKLEGKG